MYFKQSLIGINMNIFNLFLKKQIKSDNSKKPVHLNTHHYVAPAQNIC